MPFGDDTHLLISNPINRTGSIQSKHNNRAITYGVVLLVGAAAIVAVSRLNVKPEGNFPAEMADNERRQIDSCIRAEVNGRGHHALIHGFFNIARADYERGRSLRVLKIEYLATNSLFVYAGVSNSVYGVITESFRMTNFQGHWEITDDR